MRHLWRAAAAPSAQAAGGLQRSRRSRAEEIEQARRRPRKARLQRGALAGVRHSVVVRRGVAREAPSARRAGGNERGRQRGLSRARARSCRSKSLLRAARLLQISATRIEQPPIHWTSVSLATSSTSTEDPVTSLSLASILMSEKGAGSTVYSHLLILYKYVGLCRWRRTRSDRVSLPRPAFTVCPRAPP